MAPASSVPPGLSKDNPQPVTSENSTEVIGRIWTSGKPLWVRMEDGTVSQATPANAKAWLQQHGLLKLDGGQ